MRKIRFGTFLAPNIMPVYQAITDAVARTLKISTELVVETSYDNCRNDLNDVCFVCSLPYIMFEREGIVPAIPVAAPVLYGKRYRDRPIYYSDVIVKSDSDLRSFADLRGRTWSYNEPLSHSGYGITRYRLVELGETQGYFGDLIEAGFHETSIDLVRSGQVDASAIDSQVLDVFLLNDPELANEIRIIESLGPSTIQPVAISKRIDHETRAAVVDVILNIHHDKVALPDLERCLVKRFVSVGPDSYDDIRHMVDVCESNGFLTLK